MLLKDTLKAYFLLTSCVLLDYDFESVILSILLLNLCSFYLTFLMDVVITSVKGMNRLIKELLLEKRRSQNFDF